MVYDISEILDFDDKFHESFEIIANRYVPVLAKSNYPFTNTSLIGLLGSANSVKLGIYDLAEACDTHLYVIKVLHRTLIEHYLKFYYVLTRFLIEKSDDVGIEYRKYSFISETLAYINASSVTKSIAGETINDEIVKKIKEKHPDFNISKKELNEIVYKWKHRSIVRYIINKTNVVINDISYLLKLIPEYSELSSFIHGGTSAEEFYHSVFEEGNLKKYVYHEVLEAALMVSSMKLHLMLAVVEIDKSFKNDIDVLAKHIIDFTSKNT